MSNAASKEDIRRWLENTCESDAFMIVVTDCFDWSNYPVYVSENENVLDKIERLRSNNMSMIAEVYNLNMDFEDQLNDGLVWITK